MKQGNIEKGHLLQRQHKHGTIEKKNLNWCKEKRKGPMKRKTGGGGGWGKWFLSCRKHQLSRGGQENE
jgi:hypothetical protein